MAHIAFSLQFHDPPNANLCAEAADSLGRLLPALNALRAAGQRAGGRHFLLLGRDWDAGEPLASECILHLMLDLIYQNCSDCGSNYGI